MSIEDEKWTWDDEENGIVDQDGEEVRIDDLYGPAIAELPNALALLKKLRDEKLVRDSTLEKARDILRRAGVSK